MADDYAELGIRVNAPDGTQRTFREVREGFEDTAEGAEKASEKVDDSADSLRKLVRLQMGEQIMRIAVAFRQVADAAVTAFNNVDKNATAVAQASRQADQWAKSLRITANEVEALSRIFTMGNVGDDLADVGDVIKEVGVKALEAKRGSEDYVLIFKALGVDIDAAMTNATAATFQTIDALSKMENQTNALVIADELLSDQGVRLVSYLQSQGKTLTELQGETLRTIKVTDEQRAGYARLEAANRDLEVAEKRLADTLATATAPAITTVKNALADLLLKIIDTNPEFATFLGLTKEIGQPALEAGSALFTMGAAFKIMGGNLKTLLPMLGRAGLLGILLALPFAVDNFTKSWSFATRQLTADSSLWDTVIAKAQSYLRLLWVVAAGGPIGLANEARRRAAGPGVGNVGTAAGVGLGAVNPPPGFTPTSVPSPSTTVGSILDGSGASPVSPQSAGLTPSQKQVADLQATRTSLLSQQRRAEARAALAVIEANEAEGKAAAAQLAAIETMIEDAEKQLLGVLKGQELTDLLTEQAERKLRRAEERARELSAFRAEGSTSIGEEAIRQSAEAAAQARADALKAADDAVGLAQANLRLTEVTGSLDAQEAAVKALAAAYDQMATTAARAGDQLGALQAMTDKARLTASGAGKLTIGQEILAGGGVSGIEAIIRKYGGTMADLSGTVKGGMMSSYNSPSEIGQAAGAMAGPILGAAVNEAMAATVERATSAMRAGVQ